MSADDEIVAAAIYPSIGVARVGDSKAEWLLGPETPDPKPAPPGSHRDASGALKRQAARFRIYGLNGAGEIVSELTDGAREVEVTWTVELANTKAAWYGFQLALDIPEAASAPPTTLRNATITDRRQLVIRPGPRSVTKGAAAAFDTGAFMGRTVHLGEIQADEAGRLIVLGGHGVSASHDGSRATTFANNEGWFDDVADGPVTASVSLGGRSLLVTPAWVVVAPPNYGPDRKSVRTMWDLMRDVAVTAGTLARPARPSFAADILPIFTRMAGLQWVNAGFAAGFGWDGAFDLTSAAVVARLADPGPPSQELRRTIANAFRRTDTDAWSPKPWAWLYGDAMNVPTPPTPRAFAALSDLQLAFLDQWAAGDFEADYDPRARPASDLADVALKDQGDTLTRAALEFCLADAFHPGCEMTWPVRQPSFYMAPFRFAHAPAGWVAPTLPDTLTFDDLKKLEQGGVAGQQAGDITRWMAIPWQCDTASCRGGYTKEYDPFVPTFWPARVPNDVITRADYDVVMDASKPIAERRKAFARRAKWYAPLGPDSDYIKQINNMVGYFGQLGVVEQVPGPTDTHAFPAVLEVEDQRGVIPGAWPTDAPAQLKAGLLREAAEPPRIEKVNRFPNGLPVHLR